MSSGRIEVCRKHPNQECHWNYEESWWFCFSCNGLAEWRSWWQKLWRKL